MGPMVDVVVVGAGQAGLVASYLLSLDHVQHLVLERGDIGQSWRTQRWDSFHLNTPNWSNGLAGMEFHPEEPHAFAGRNELVAFFEDYASIFQPSDQATYRGDLSSKNLERQVCAPHPSLRKFRPRQWSSPRGD